jgi:hypothetical protein
MTQAAINIELYFSGTVEDKLNTARKLYAEHAVNILKQQNIKDRLNQLQQYESALDTHMSDMQMGKRCSACAARAKGGCCSSYMAGNTDAILLLINLLMGVDVVIQHQNKINCCFLGSQGCILPIKPIFCLNYNCTHIQKAASISEMLLLDKRAGTLLSLQTRIEGILLELIRQP